MMDDGYLVLAMMAFALFGGCSVGRITKDLEHNQACEAHCAPYAVDESADICQCQQVSPAVVAEDCGQ